MPTQGNILIFYLDFFFLLQYTYHKFKYSLGWPNDPGPSLAGQTLAFFISMKELSIFVDEIGDFGEYDYHSPCLT